MRTQSLNILCLFLFALVTITDCGCVNNKNINEETLKAFNVTYNGNGSSSGSVPVDNTRYKHGQIVTVLGNSGNLVNNGFSFIGWNTQSDGNGILFSQGQTFTIGPENVILYASWTVHITYVVTYIGNDNDSGTVPIDSTHYEQGHSVVILGNTGNLVRNGYTFIGWNTQSDGNGILYSQGQTFVIGSANAILYANWTANPTFTVAYDDNESIAGTVPIDSMHYEQGQTVTVLDNTGNLEKDGYSFAGWNTQSDGNGTFYLAGAVFTINSANVTLYADYKRISFITTGSSFSPVIIVNGSPNILWIWDDNSTDNSTNPTKIYGSNGNRVNHLSVNPWSALKRINIGYDAGDGGSASIEHVADQYVSSVQGLEAVAPYLQQWCSSYNEILSLDFSNFTQLDTIECFYSYYLESVDLTNTPLLQRACFENCNLIALNLSESPMLQDLRGAQNNYPTINFGDIGSDIWHICIRDNPQMTDTDLFSDISQFPNIEELYTWNDNQFGALIVPSTGITRNVDIIAYNNYYTSADFTGALKNISFSGRIIIYNNQLTDLNITGCVQLTYLDARNNNLSSAMVDYILVTLDSLGRTGGYVDLTGNTAPSIITYITNLQNKGWSVYTD